MKAKLPQKNRVIGLVMSLLVAALLLGSGYAVEQHDCRHLGDTHQHDCPLCWFSVSSAENTPTFQADSHERVVFSSDTALFQSVGCAVPSSHDSRAPPSR